MLRLKRQRIKKIHGISDFIKEVFYGAASLTNAFIPKGNIISFCSFPDFSDNARVFYEYFQKKNIENDDVDYKIIWHVYDVKEAKARNKKVKLDYPNVKFVRKNRFWSFFYFCRSRYIFSTHGLFYMVMLTNKQVHYYLGHGMPVKRIGSMYENDRRLGILQADYFIVCSAFFKKIFKKAFCTSEEKILVAGQPRNKLLFERNSKLDTLLNGSDKELIIYLPTYRVSNNKNQSNGTNVFETDSIYGGSIEEWKEVDEVLKKNNQRMIIKPHPMEKYDDSYFDFQNIIIINEEWLRQNNILLNELLAYSSRLITDFSGVFIDYLLLDRPICFYASDYEDYKNSRGLLYDPKKYMPGDFIHSVQEIKFFLASEDTHKEERARVRRVFHEVGGTDSCKMIYDHFNRIRQDQR